MKKNFVWNATQKTKRVFSKEHYQDTGSKTRLIRVLRLMPNFKVILSILSLALLSSAIFFHPFFQITDIKTVGRVRISEERVKASMESYMKERIFFVKKSSVFLFSEEAAAKHLLKELPLENAEVRVSFPKNVEIILREKTGSILVSNGIEYALIDNTGMILEFLGKVPAEDWQNVSKKIYTTVSSTLMVSSTVENVTSTVTVVTTTIEYVPDMRLIRQKFGAVPFLISLSATSTESFWASERLVSTVLWLQNTMKRDPFLGKGLQISYVKDVGEEGLVVFFTNKTTKWKISKKIESDILEKSFSGIEKIIKENEPSIIDLRYVPKIFWE